MLGSTSVERSIIPRIARMQLNDNDTKLDPRSHLFPPDNMDQHDDTNTEKVTDDLPSNSRASNDLQLTSPSAVLPPEESNKGSENTCEDSTVHHSREIDDHEFPNPVSTSPLPMASPADLQSFAPSRNLLKNSVSTAPILRDIEQQVEPERSVLPKYIYAEKFLAKPMSTKELPSRMRLAGNCTNNKSSSTKLKKYYNTRRGKSDEIILLHRASNTIVAIFAATRKCLQVSLDSLNAPVATFLDSSVHSPEAWICVIAEALKLISTEYLLYESAVQASKKREMATAKQVMSSKLKESSDRMAHYQRLIDDLDRELKECDRTVESVCTGCRSRFYQSVWQTDVRLRQNGHGDSAHLPAHQQVQQDIMDANCSSSLSTSSLMSLHLLTPYIRWDVDGISIKKQVSKSWPLIKFSALSFLDKIEGVREILDGFQSFLQIPIQHIENALSALQETSIQHHLEEITLLDFQFRTILDVLLSERYFYPEEQQKGLTYARRIKENFRLLQTVAEDVKLKAFDFREAWKRAFKNGELTMLAAMLSVQATNVPLWKSCKDFSFQLDLQPESLPRSTSFPSLKTKITLDQSSQLPTDKQPKVLTPNFYQALVEHLELFEDFDDSYEQRLLEMKRRKDLVIFEEDLWPCTDLAQQLFFHFENIGNTLNTFSKGLDEMNNLLLSAVPTDPPTIPTNYTHFSPWRMPQDFIPADQPFVVSLIGWLAAILEILSSTTETKIRLNSTSNGVSLQEKCSRLSKSLVLLNQMLNICIKHYQKTEKCMERILNNVEKYFKMLDDSVKFKPNVPPPQPAQPPPKVPETVEETLDELMKVTEGEVSIFVTVNGIYFNQFGIVFSSRLDGQTSAEHRLRIAELFVNHVLFKLDAINDTLKRMLDKFGTPNPPVPWWQQLTRTPTDNSLLVEGDLEGSIYSKTIFHLFKNIQAAFSKLNVKANLEIYSELEAIILIRTTRILEEEVVRFGHACQGFHQGLATLEGFQRYFKKSCTKFFSHGRMTPPFEKWNHQLSCYKLLIDDEHFKLQLDKILNSSPSETTSPTGSEHRLPIHPTQPSHPKINTSSVIQNLNDLVTKWQQLELDSYKNLTQKDAYLPEAETTASKLIDMDSTNPSRDRNYISQTEATAILIAHAILQLKMEALPKTLKVAAVKKLYSLSNKLKECQAILSHSIGVSEGKNTKINERLHHIIGSYSHMHKSNTQPLDDLTTAPHEAIATVVVEETGKKTLDQELTTEELTMATTAKGRKAAGERDENMEQDTGGEDVSDLDVFITLNFPYETLILSYRGYERSTCFRSWSSRPSDQAALLDIMIESISDRLAHLVDSARKISNEYASLSRSLLKLIHKIDQALPLPLSALTAITDGLKVFKETLQVGKPIRVLEGADEDLKVTDGHLKLAISFCEKHIEMAKEINFSVSDFTVNMRNPYEKAIRDIFTKPIRVTIPYDKFGLKLW